MQRYSSTVIIQFVLLWFVGSPAAQKNIIISDSLAAHADTLEIDVDFQSDHKRTFNFGGYTIVPDNEMSGTYSTTKEKLLGMRIVTDITKTISFIVNSDVSDTAEVYAEEVNRVNSYYPNEVLENFIIDESSSTKFKSLAAWITINGDTNTTWTLYVPKGKGKERKFPIEMLLTDGVKFINITTVSSDLYFDYSHPLRSMLKMPAMGVEFMDSGKSICAVQFDAGATTGYYPEDKESLGCKAWMHQHLDAKTQLVMAAAMSTIILMYNPYLVLNE